jgi:hypothetical protein
MKVNVMRLGILFTGFAVLFLGLTLMLFLWPLTGYETKDSIGSLKEQSGGTLRYVGSITDIERSGQMYSLEMDHGVLSAYSPEEDFEEGDRVLVTIQFGENTTNWYENTYSVQKVPTNEGIMGFLLSICGLLVTIYGLAAKIKDIGEIVKFEIHPVVDSDITSAKLRDMQTEVPDQKALGGSKETQGISAGEKLERVSCPKCGNVFCVSGDTRPAQISCPQCGLKGMLN